jgi:hypothetical protein
MSSLFRNLTEPLIETPRERRAPDCVGMDVWLESPGTTDGSGRFVCGGSVRSRGAKRVKGCMARIVRNYSTFGKRNHSRLTLSSSTNAVSFSSARTTKRLPSSRCALKPISRCRDPRLLRRW